MDKEMMKERFKRAALVGKKVMYLAPIVMCGNPMVASATSANDTSFLTKTGGTDYFSGLTNTAQDLGASGFKMVKTVCIAGLAISVLIAGGSIALASNGNKRTEGKDRLVNGLLGGAVIFGALSIIGLAASIGGNLNFS